MNLTTAAVNQHTKKATFRMDFFSFCELCVPLVAILGNLMALDGVVHGNIAIAGYRRFLISLLASDIYICVVKISIATSEKILQPFFNVSMQLHKCLGEIGRSLEIGGYIAYLLNLCGMFIDHYIALVHAHNYRFVSRVPFKRSTNGSNRHVCTCVCVCVCVCAVHLGGCFFFPSHMARATFYPPYDLDYRPCMYNQRSF